MEEQFIQDAISKQSRLQRVLHLLGYADWRSEHGDVLNQEFNFSATDSSGARLGGRMDVVATFNGQTRFLIVEVKVIATRDDVKQLSWYMDHCSTIGEDAGAGLDSSVFSQRVGILLAQEFVPGCYETEGKIIRCVRFRFDGSEFPFEEFTDNSVGQAEETAPAVFKHSRIVTIKDHKNLMRNDLHDAFDELRHLCLPLGDSRFEWIIENPKGGHVAIHYKGTYVVYFFVRKNSFDVGYTLPGGEGIRYRVGAGGQATLEVLEEARVQIPLILEGIDKQDECRGIPPEFAWSNFDGD